ncbi:PTS system, glucitol/sorbitol-specific, IIC component [Enterococcus faecium EnGen0024]|uniref:PTS system glucitol/sorbitol-specific IIC component n=1 Tax=Enterococcus faecium 10/96A TaxID=1391465 RepID=A0AAV3L4M4_ENTFC|nr:PTS system, glucitol/sorbitol-specific, IIC component [Enterococcus faecium EnGen0024]ERT50930.1 PTS system glucitol/sorbitol-specific IIC component [Enterococcus faecium 10/96A]
MDIITKFAERFMRLFQTGAETFISWMTGIVPVVLMLMVAMNTLIAFLGEDRVTKVAKLSAKNPLTRYLVLPFLSAFMLGNPMSFTMARFLPEYYKPSYYAAQAQFCHTSNGVFPILILENCLYGLGLLKGSKP